MVPLGVVRSLTLVAIVLAIIGPFLPGPQIAGVTLFPYRLFLPGYLGVLLLTLATQPGATSIELPRPTIPLFGVLAVVIISIGYTSNFSATVRGIILFGANFLLLVGIVWTLNDRRWVYRGWLTLFILSLLALGVIALEYVTGWHSPVSQIHSLPEYPPYTYYATAFFRNVNDTGFFLSIAGMFPLTMAIYPRTIRWLRAGMFSLWVIGIWFALRVGARAILAAYALAFVFSVALVHGRAVRRAITAPTTRFSRVIMSAFGIIAVVAFMVLPNPFPKSATSLWIRWQLHKAAIAVGGLFGTGIGAGRFAIENKPIPTGGISSPHSWAGAFIADIGILGLFLFLLFYGGLFAALLQRSTGEDPVAVMSVGAIVIFPVAAIGPSNATLTAMFWVTLGLGIATLMDTLSR